MATPQKITEIVTKTFSTKTFNFSKAIKVFSKPIKAVSIVLFFSLVVILLTSSALAAVKTFRVTETEFVKVAPEAVDPDDDDVSYHFSEPLDEFGEWQTDYGDAGEYNVTITASDGKTESTETVRIVVLPRNQPPRLLEKMLVIKEGQTVDLRELVEDPEDDPLAFDFSLPFTKQGIWETTYADEGSYVVTFSAHDGEYIGRFRVQLEVLHTNQPPEIIDLFSEDEQIDVKENEILTFYASAIDDSSNYNGNDQSSNDNSKNDDGKKTAPPLTYSWAFDGEVITLEDKGERSFSYEDAGEYTLTLSVSDGEKTTERSWIINIENVNRRPALELLPIIAYENDKIIIEVPEKDLDGETLTYQFEEPLNDQGEWRTSFKDAGHYSLEITAFDGEQKGGGKVEVTILDVDRKPSLELPPSIFLAEDEPLNLEIQSEDPDEDMLTFSFEGLPEEASFDQEEQILTWTPGYDFIRRKGGFFSEILNALRIEHKFLQERKLPVTITSCGKDLCNTAETMFIVRNINRAPQFYNLANSSVLETEALLLQLKAEDPDGDIVRYFFGSPLGRRDGKWTPDFTDRGIHPMTVTASDGDLETSITYNVTVLNNNRLPSLTIKDDSFTINENEELSFKVEASDPDQDDVLTIQLENVPSGASFDDGLFVWTPTYETVTYGMANAKNADGKNSKESKTSKGPAADEEKSLFPKKNSARQQQDQQQVVLNFVASDGEIDVVHPVSVTIKNVNQAPEIVNAAPAQELTIEAFDPLTLLVNVKDNDGDNLSYTWDFGIGEEELAGTNTIQRTFTSPGRKKIQFTATDGFEEVSHEFTINVIEQEKQAPPAVQPILQPPMTFKVLVVKG